MFLGLLFVTFEYMATIGFHCLATGCNYFSLSNSRGLTWIRKCHKSCHRHSCEQKMGENSVLGQLSF